VDPPLSRSRDRHASLERQAGGVGKQVADGRSLRAGRAVEVDDALLGGDERGERRRELRDGGPAHRPFAVSVRTERRTGVEDGRVRTRFYVTRAEDFDAVGRAHGEVFGRARPATTGVVVKGLLDPRWLVEIEAIAVLPPR